VSVENLSKLILYKREINRTVLCEFSESKLVLYKREINRRVLCECRESIEVDTLHKRDK